MCLWEKVCRLAWTGYMNTSASAVSGKETRYAKVIPQLWGFSVQHVVITHNLQHLTVCVHQCIELRDPHSSYWCKHKRAWETEIYKVCTHTVLSYSTHITLIHTYRNTHSHKQSTSLQFPKQLWTRQTLLPGGLLLKMNLQSPLRKTAFCRGCPGTLTVAVSLHTQTLTAVMRRRGAPTLRQGNWLEMMGHKHTSQGRRSAKQTAN